LLELLDLLPAGRPFLTAESDARGVGNDHRRMLVRWGLLRRPVRGVFHRADLTDDLTLRLAVLGLVVPSDCVVTDRTAAWLWGAPMVLAPGDHRQVPRVSVFAPPGRRLRNLVAASGERILSRDDVVRLDGVQVTSQLRTACDLARLLHRDQALAAVDMLARVGAFGVDDLVAELDRFKGYRGVVQARMLAPLLDARSESPMESIARLRWHDAGLPWPDCQVEVEGPHGSYFVDVGRAKERFGVEYFGKEFHSDDDEVDDQRRLTWLREQQGWTIIVARRDDVVGPRQHLDISLRRAWEAHRALTRRS
jgi:hypothetical protein